MINCLSPALKRGNTLAIFNSNQIKSNQTAFENNFFLQLLFTKSHIEDYLIVYLLSNFKIIIIMYFFKLQFNSKYLLLLFYNDDIFIDYIYTCIMGYSLN